MYLKLISQEKHHQTNTVQWILSTKHCQNQNNRPYSNRALLIRLKCELLFEDDKRKLRFKVYRLIRSTVQWLLSYSLLHPIFVAICICLFKKCRIPFQLPLKPSPSAAQTLTFNLHRGFCSFFLSGAGSSLSLSPVDDLSKRPIRAAIGITNSALYSSIRHRTMKFILLRDVYFLFPS